MYYCEYSFYGFDRIPESVSVMGYNIFAFDSKKSRDEYVAKNEYKHGNKVMRPINTIRLVRVVGKKFSLSQLGKEDFYLVLPEKSYKDIIIK